jgi:hypothetical protein
MDYGSRKVGSGSLVRIFRFGGTAYGVYELGTYKVSLAGAVRSAYPNFGTYLFEER